MRWEDRQSNLRYKLGNLFPYEQAIRAIVRDTDSDLEASIIWQGSAINCWSEVLKEARNRHLELKLVQAVRKAYPQDEELQTTEGVLAEHQALSRKYPEDRLVRLSTIITQLSIPNDQLRDLYQKSVPANWESPDKHCDLKTLIQNLLYAPHHDGIDPLFEFAERIARHKPKENTQLRAWINEIPYITGNVVSLLHKKLKNEKHHSYQQPYVIIKLEAKITGKYRLQAWLFCKDKADVPDMEELAPDDDGCTLKNLSGRIESVLQKVEKGLSDRGLNQKPIIELFLPEKLLNHDMNKVLLTFGKEKLPVGRRYPLVIRSLDRITSNNSGWKEMSLRKWQNKWKQFGKGDAHLQPKYYDEDDCKTHFHEKIEDDICLVFTFVPPVAQKSRKWDIFSTIADEGVPVVLWPRQAVKSSPKAELGELLPVLFAQDRLCMPEILLAMRKKHFEDDQHLSHYIALLWENPDHLPPDFDTKASAPQEAAE